jgi:hypothetical protein
MGDTTLTFVTARACILSHTYINMNTIVFCFLEKKDDTWVGFCFWPLFSRFKTNWARSSHNLYASREQSSIDGGIQALLIRH